MTELKCPICGEKVESFNSGFVCFRHCLHGKNVWGSEEVLKELADTKKKLDICVKALNKIANTDIKVIEKEPLYYARAMFSVTNNALGRIQDIEQKDGK